MQRLLIALLVIASFTLVSCGGKRVDSSVTDSINNANYYLNLARNSAQPEKSEYLLQAGIVLAKQAQYLKAQETFLFLDPQFLSELQREDYYLYYGYSLQQLDQGDAALKFFRRITSPNSHPLEWQIFYRKQLSVAYLTDGNYYEAAKMRVELEDLLLNPEDVSENHQFIWQALKQITPNFLKVFQNDFASPMINGWLEIAHLTVTNENSPEKLLAALNLWKQRFPTHPANIQLPEELQKVSEAKTYQPKQIALLLPLSGTISNSGRMVRDGFLAAHYSRQFASNAPIIKVYDTALSISVMTTYQKALDDGADFIVGPLTKEAVNEIAASDALTIPQLSLNRVDEVANIHPEFYQFGLPIEDEAKQIAQLAIQKNQKTAILLAPNNDQGDRIIQTFTKTFEELQGEIAEVQRFDKPKEIKTVIRDLLNIDRSEQREKRLKQILGEELEYVQRRRQDADMVFLAASPTDARRIKPFLNYYFAHDLPVYAISKINDGNRTKRLNNDLNGIIFTDSPLLISNSSDIKSLRSNLSELLPATNSPYGRLFALGFDAYQLLPDLNIMQAFKQYQQIGLSGKLAVNDQGEIERTLSVAQFKKGLANEIVETPADLENQ